MGNGNSTQRRRGVTASRARLTHALTIAGLKTQAALADRIAEIEGLETAPKDAVSRAFRELAVDPQTLERIAQALGVEAYTLYKSADEEPLLQPVHAVAANQGRRWPVLVAATIVGLLGVGWWLQTDDEPPGVEEAASPLAIPQLDLGATTLVVMPLNGDEGDVLGHAVREKLAETYSVANDSANVLARSLDPVSVADKLRADAVLDGEIVTVGRLAGLRFYLYSRGVRRQIWGESHPLVALDANRGGIADRATLAVRRATGYPVPAGELSPHFPLAPVQDDYLEGEFQLDRPSNELNIKRAQSRFEAALRQDSNYARAHAGLCQTLLEEHWMSDEARALKDAALACGQAVQLNPDDQVVAAAHAHYLRRTGRTEEAIALYETVVREHPLDASAWTGLASALLQAYRQSGEPGLLASAKQAARMAANVDPLVWKSLFALGTMEYFDANVSGAISATAEALARDKNEYVAANLGTFYLCDGDYEKAVDAYLLAQQLAPGSYVGDEFLGSAYYFMGNFAESARLRKRAIDSISTGDPEIHEMWGNLGDAYRQLGQTRSAVDAYLHAAEIAERDHLRGTAPAADRAALAYYYTVLRSLDEELVPPAIEDNLRNELPDIGTSLVSATAHRRMAQTWLLRGNIDKAKESLQKATATCRGYAGLPDLQILAKKGKD